MSSDKVELVEDLLDDFGFRVRWRYSDYWADVEVFEYIGQESNGDGTMGRKLLPRKDAMHGMDTVYDIDEAEPYLAGFIKWDGCSELDMGCPHWCGPHDFRKHFAILEAIYRRAQELMARGNDQPWDRQPLTPPEKHNKEST